MPDVLRDQIQSSLGTSYAIDRELGGGGMSRVFVAEETALGREVVIKVLAPELADGISTERFAREIRIVARLQHPNIVPVLSAGQSGTIPYYTMPFVRGETLRAHLARGALDLRAAVRILADIARALAYAHRESVVHRDIKPENVLLADGIAMVADFGIARAVAIARTNDGATLTQLGTAIGTPAYMAPEQAAGDPDVDHRADLYALGIVAWEALAGRHPFADRSTALALIGAQLTRVPEPLGDVCASVPPALATLIARCLAKDPAERPPDADAIVRELDALALTPSTPLPAARLKAAHNDGVPMLAVLPMVNTSGDSENEHFSDGLTDELIGAFSTVDSLRVIGRSSSFALKGRALGVAEVARMLGVQHVLEGSVRRAGQRMKARVQLVSANGAVLWSEAFDRTVDDVFAVQEEVARAVVDALKVRLGDTAAPIVRRPTTDLVAHDLYLKGRSAQRAMYAAALREAVGYYKQAIDRDPNFAAAHAAASWTYAGLPIVSDISVRDVVAQARAHAQRALALDDRLAAAHLAMGHVLYAMDLDLPAAGRALRRALELDSGNPEIHIQLAVWYTGQRHLPDAERHAKIALAAEPLMGNAHFVLGWVYAASGRPHLALPYLTTAAAAPAAFVREILAHTYLDLGRTDDALAEAYRAAAVGSRRDRALVAYMLARAGRRAEAAAIIDEMLAPAEVAHAPPCQMAIAYCGLGDLDAAIGWLERAFDDVDPHLNGLAIIPAYAPLRDDPRFQALVARLRHEPPVSI